VLAIVAGVGLAVVATVRSATGLGETMYSEGWLLHSILRVRDGQPLYTDYGGEPFILALYTPLYYLLNSA